MAGDEASPQVLVAKAANAMFQAITTTIIPSNTYIDDDNILLWEIASLLIPDKLTCRTRAEDEKIDEKKELVELGISKSEEESLYGDSLFMDAREPLLTELHAACHAHQKLQDLADRPTQRSIAQIQLNMLERFVGGYAEEYFPSIDAHIKRISAWLGEISSGKLDASRVNELEHEISRNFLESLDFLLYQEVQSGEHIGNPVTTMQMKQAFVPNDAQKERAEKEFDSCCKAISDFISDHGLGMYDEQFQTLQERFAHIKAQYTEFSKSEDRVGYFHGRQKVLSTLQKTARLKIRQGDWPGHKKYLDLYRNELTDVFDEIDSYYKHYDESEWECLIKLKALQQKIQLKLKSRDLFCLEGAFIGEAGYDISYVPPYQKALARGKAAMYYEEKLLTRRPDDRDTKTYARLTAKTYNGPHREPTVIHKAKTESDTTTLTRLFGVLLQLSCHVDPAIYNAYSKTLFMATRQLEYLEGNQRQLTAQPHKGNLGVKADDEGLLEPEAVISERDRTTIPGIEKTKKETEQELLSLETIVRTADVHAAGILEELSSETSPDIITAFDPKDFNSDGAIYDPKKFVHLLQMMMVVSQKSLPPEQEALPGIASNIMSFHREKAKKMQAYTAAEAHKKNSQ